MNLERCFVNMERCGDIIQETDIIRAMGNFTDFPAKLKDTMDDFYVSKIENNTIFGNYIGTKEEVEYTEPLFIKIDQLNGELKKNEQRFK